jgi:hypothetical protein
MPVAWIGAVVIVSAQGALDHSNNFEIFRASFRNLLDGGTLYAPTGAKRDLLLYPPPFAVLFAPFALLPFWAGLLLWNAVNAGALYWALGRVLAATPLALARGFVFMDTLGNMQNAQSNALVAGLMIAACGALDRRRHALAAWALGIATAVKVFPATAAAYALFRPYRLRRFVLAGLVAGAAIAALPLVVATPGEWIGHWREWLALQGAESLQRGHSVMYHLHALGLDAPNWPVQLLGLAVLLAPLLRLQFFGLARFRLLFLASVLMFCVLFNHAAESPTFVIAVAGVALWYTQSDQARLDRMALALVLVVTVLSSSEAVPHPVQEWVFEPYRLKTLPILLVWVLTQLALWRQSAPARFRAPTDAPAAQAT